MPNAFLPLRGRTYTKEPYDDFIAKLPTPGWELNDLGESEAPGKRIYELARGSDTDKPVILVQGGIHGHEWQSAYYVLELVKQMSDSEHPNHIVFTRLLSKFAFRVIPLLNPGGYELGRRTNPNGVDLNRNYLQWWDNTPTGEGTSNYKGPAPLSEKETQISRGRIEAYRPFAFFDCHTWGAGSPDRTSLFIYPRELNNTQRVLLDDLEAKYSVTQETGTARLTRWGVARAVHDAHFIQSAAGTTPLTCICEITRSVSDEDIMRFGMNMLLSLFLVAEQWFENRAQRVTR